MKDQHFAKRILKWIVPVRDNEIRAVVLSTLFFFLLFAGYYPLRALRETMGVESGVSTIPLLWTCTLVVMLLINPIYAWIVSHFPRRVFIPFVYRFFLLNLVIFFALSKLLPQEVHVYLGRTFYVWLSVFNLFVVSVAWGFIDDMFSSAQGKRLFGFVASGASIGGLVGSAFTIYLADKIDPINVMVFSIVMIEASARCIRPLDRAAKTVRGGEQSNADERQAQDDAPIRGTMWDGMRRVASSRYLLTICLFMFFLSLMGTFLYMVQAEIAADYFDDRSSRIVFFARINLVVNGIAALIQIFVTARVMKSFGVGVTLGLLPIIAVVAFAGLGIALLTAQIGLIFWVFIIAQVGRRAGNYALARPSREVLYTVVPRQDKYKAKTFIDTFITRASDQVNVWGFQGLVAMKLSVAAIMFVAIPLAVGWFVLALALGARQKRLAEGPRCDTCGYDLRGGNERCPECGAAV